MKTANMGNRVRVGALLTMFVVATLMLVMTHATPALAAGSTAASFEANSYDFSVDENTAANTVVGTVAATDPDGGLGAPGDPSEQVGHEVGAAPLPAGSAEDCGDGASESLMSVRYHQLHPAEAPGGQRA